MIEICIDLGVTDGSFVDYGGRVDVESECQSLSMIEGESSGGAEQLQKALGSEKSKMS
jgi:hypothetical protein